MAKADERSDFSRCPSRDAVACSGRRTRPCILFVHSAYLGWRTYSSVVRTLVAGCEDIDARFTASAGTGRPALSRWRRFATPMLSRLLRTGRRFVLGAVQYLRARRKRRPDAVHAAGHLMGFVPSVVDPRCPLLVTLDGTGRQLREMRAERSPIEPVRLALERWLLRRCARIDCTSAWAARSVIDDFGVDAAKVHVTPYFIFGPDAAHVQRGIDARSETGPIDIAFVGNDLQRKGGETLLDVRREHFFDRVTIHLFTSDARADNIDEPGVVVHGPTSNRQLVEELLPSMDLFVLPTLFDQTPFAIIEAMAAGVPVVATDIGGVGELVEHGVTGLLIPAANPVALRDAMETLLHDGALRRSMAHAARRAFETRFDAKTVGRRFVDELTGAS